MALALTVGVSMTTKESECGKRKGCAVHGKKSCFLRVNSICLTQILSALAMGRSLYGRVHLNTADANVRYAAEKAFGWMTEQRQCQVVGCTNKGAKYCIIEHSIDEIQGRDNNLTALCQSCMKAISTIATVTLDPEFD